MVGGGSDLMMMNAKAKANANANAIANANATADPNVSSFTASINILKGILQQKSAGRDSNHGRDNDHRTTVTAAVAETTDGPPDWLPETWQAKLLGVETELMDERAQRKAVEEAHALLRVKVTTELEPTLANLQSQVDRLSHEKEQYATDLEKARAAHGRTTEQLEATVLLLRDKESEIATLAGREKDRVAAAVDRERQRHADEVKSLQLIMAEIANDRDQARSLLDRQRHRAERNVTTGDVNDYDEGTTTSRHDDMEAMPPHSSSPLVLALVSNLQEVVDMANLAFIRFTELVSYDHPPDECSLEAAMGYKDEFDTLASRAMELITSFWSTVPDAAARTEDDQPEEMVEGMQDDDYDDNYHNEPKKSGPLSESHGAAAKNVDTIEDGPGGEESPDGNVGESLETVGTLRDAATGAVHKRDANMAASESRMEEQEAGQTACATAGGGDEEEDDDDDDVDDSGTGMASATEGGQGAEQTKSIATDTGDGDSMKVATGDPGNAKRQLALDDNETKDNNKKAKN